VYDAYNEARKEFEAAEDENTDPGMGLIEFLKLTYWIINPSARKKTVR